MTKTGISLKKRKGMLFSIAFLLLSIGLCVLLSVFNNQLIEYLSVYFNHGSIDKMGLISIVSAITIAKNTSSMFLKMPETASTFSLRG